MSIGEVLAELRGEFPDITISKLRFLEAEGLVEPRRTPAGYRKYSTADVARLRRVADRGVREDPAAPRLDRAELLARSGLTEPVLAELEQHGLIRDRAGRYDADALAVARVAAQLARYGLEPRHLRGYRTAADREVGLFAQLVLPLARQNTPAARDRAAETVRELTALSQQLHAALVRAGLRETLGQ